MSSDVSPIIKSWVDTHTNLPLRARWSCESRCGPEWDNEARAVSTLREEGFVVGSLVSDALVDAYRQTRFRVLAGAGPFTLRIDERSFELSGLMAAQGSYSAAYLTAENPFSIAISADENAVRQANLKADLDAIGALTVQGEGEGADPTWPPEASWLALGLTRDQACALGTKYGQNAIVSIGADAIPELVILR